MSTAISAQPAQPTSLAKYSSARGILFGIIGGIIAGILVFFFARFFLPAVPSVKSVFTLTSLAKLAYPSSAPAYDYTLGARIFLGIVVGAIFGGGFARKHRFQFNRMSFGVVLAFGLLTGFVIWIVLSLLGVVTVDIILYPHSYTVATLATYSAYTLARYLVFGLILGAVVGLLLPTLGLVRKKTAVERPLVTQPTPTV
jgi:hypothetical protein